MDKLKYVKIENEDGSLSDNIPLGVDAENVDVTSADNSQNLADYISVNDGKINSINSQIDNLQDSSTSLSNQIKSLSSGSPKGSYATVSALKSANPETGVYVIQEDGHLYSWTKNGSDAIDLGVYQAVLLGDNVVSPDNIKDILKRGMLYSTGIINIDIYTNKITRTSDVFLITNNECLNINDAFPWDYSSIVGSNYSVYVNLYYNRNSNSFEINPISGIGFNEDLIFLGQFTRDISLSMKSSFINSNNCIYINNRKLSTIYGFPKNSRTVSLGVGKINISREGLLDKVEILENTMFDVGNGYITISSQSLEFNNTNNRELFVFYNLYNRTLSIRVVGDFNFFGYASVTASDDEILLFSFHASPTFNKVYCLGDLTIFTINGLRLGGYNYALEEDIIPTKGKKMNVLGDSITEGVGASSSPYTNTIKDILKLNTIRNYGISGSAITTRPSQPTHENDGFCQRFDDMSDDADIIFVLGGTNDYWTNVPLGTIDSNDPETFYGALNTLCVGLINKYPNAFITFGTPPKSWRTNGSFPNEQNSNGNTPEDFNKAIKEVCAKFTIPVLDLKHELGIDPEQNIHFSKFTSDGVHYNASGYGKIGKTISNFILSKYNIFE